MLDELKERVCKANKELIKQRLVFFTWGNVSQIDKESGIVAIKPSGISFESLTPKDIVLVDINGKVIEGDKRPSSDTPTHLELYRSFDKIKSVIHTHSTFATIFAQAKKPIECLGTTHADHFYGTVPLIRDLTEDEVKNNYELNTGKAIIEHFQKNNIDPLKMPACLIASHGPFTWGETIEEALHHAILLEHIARIKLETKNLNPNIGPIDSFLLDKHYLRKHGKDAYYGQKRN